MYGHFPKPGIIPGVYPAALHVGFPTGYVETIEWEVYIPDNPNIDSAYCDPFPCVEEVIRWQQVSRIDLPAHSNVGYCEVYDTSGRLLTQYKPSEHTRSINILASYQEGVYILRFVDKYGLGLLTKKIFLYH